MSYSLMDFSEQLADTTQTYSRFVVRVEGRPQRASSGIIWARQGLVVTSSYALSFDEHIWVGLPDGRRVSATLLGRDPGVDVALLHLNLDDPQEELVSPAWGSAEGLRLGHVALILARPATTPRIAHGVVSTLSGAWKTPQGGVLDRYIQTDCMTRSGFSGGLVVDAQGVTIGMVTAGLVAPDHVVVPTKTLQVAINGIVARYEESATP